MIMAKKPAATDEQQPDQEAAQPAVAIVEALDMSEPVPGNPDAPPQPEVATPQALAQEPPATPDVTVRHLRVVAKVGAGQSFRRAGRVFTCQPSDILVEDLSEAELAALFAEPRLDCVFIGE